MNFEILENETLQIAGILIGIFGIILALRYRKRRVLSYSFPIRRQIFSNEFAMVDNLDLQLNGRTVRDLFLVELEIVNKGNETLYPEDFLKPLELQFDKVVNLIPISVERKKSDIPLTWEVDTEKNATVLRLQTKLIEPKDVITVSMIYESDSFADYSMRTRIIDGSLKYNIRYEEMLDENYRYRIYRKYKGMRRFTTFVLFGLFVFVSSLFFNKLFPGFDSNDYNTWISLAFPFARIFFLIALFIFSAVLADKMFDKKQKKEIDEMERSLALRREAISKK